ncbi:FAD-dependent monooxygenase [Streptomyces sp. NPDC047043]|uniref:FAD-dependent monooxygenase n=1 Tax=Streptomyces sp. NPDC047043 TaxID=3154497 RepID=UPI00340D5C4C
MSGTDVTITTMLSGTRWIDTARQATLYRAGRVLLAGDAAPRVRAGRRPGPQRRYRRRGEPRLEARGRGMRLGRRGHPRHVHHNGIRARRACCRTPGPRSP